MFIPSVHYPSNVFKVTKQFEERKRLPNRILYSLLFPHVFMVIQSMRFIDNGRIVPQELKAFSVNPFFEPSAPGGCTLSSVHSRSFPGETMMPPIQLSDLNRSQKNLIYPLCPTLPGEERGRKIEWGELMREKVKKGGSERTEAGFFIWALGSCRLCTRLML